MREYLLCLAAAAAVTYLLVPVIRALAIRAGAMAEVRDRDVHTEPTPRWGGLAMLGGLGASVILASQLPLMGTIFRDHKQIQALALGVLAIVALGLVDDKWSLDAPTKLAGQMFAAAVMASNGLTLVWLPINGTLILDPTLSVLLTVLVVVVSINAVNMVDGLDGLAATIVCVGSAAFFSYSYFLSVANGYQRAALATLVSAATVGATIGFLPHNWFRARIFMGDTGSMLLGLLMAAASVMLTGQVDQAGITDGNLLPAFLPIILPLSILFVPLLDLLMAVLRRTSRGRSPFSPDKQHMHHRLLDLGHGQQRAVLIMGAVTGVIAFGTVSTAFVPLWITWLLLAVSAVVLLIWVASPTRNVEVGTDLT